MKVVLRFGIIAGLFGFPAACRAPQAGAYADVIQIWLGPALAEGAFRPEDARRLEPDAPQISDSLGEVWTEPAPGGMRVSRAYFRKAGSESVVACVFHLFPQNPTQGAALFDEARRRFTQSLGAPLEASGVAYRWKGESTTMRIRLAAAPDFATLTVNAYLEDEP